jgi:hypothetical protein
MIIAYLGSKGHEYFISISGVRSTIFSDLVWIDASKEKEGGSNPALGGRLHGCSFTNVWEALELPSGMTI